MKLVPLYFVRALWLLRSMSFKDMLVASLSEQQIPKDRSQSFQDSAQGELVCCFDS